MPDPNPDPDASVVRAPTFSPARQCHWCGGSKLDSVHGYAGERRCLTCGWGGDGEPDVPCMYYKIIRQPEVRSDGQ